MMNESDVAADSTLETDSVSTGSMLESNRTSTNSWESLMVAFYAMPIVLLMAVFAWGFMIEIQDQSNVNNFVANKASDWNASGSGELEQLIDERMSPEEAVIWDSMFRAIDRFEDNADETVEAFEMLTPPDQPWSAKPYAKRKAADWEWIDRQRDQMDEVRKPVWIPSTNDYAGDWYRQFNAARRLLQHDANVFRVAYNEGDRDAAMNVFRRMNQTIAAVDWRAYRFSNHQWIDHQKEVMTLIRDSVRFPFWSDEELAQLRSLLSPDWRIQQRFADTTQRSILNILEIASQINLDSREDWRSRDLRVLLPFGISDTHVWEVLQSQQRVLRVPQPGTWKHAREVRRIESRLMSGGDRDPAFSLVAIPFAQSFLRLADSGVFSLAKGFARLETERRWTMTAVAVRQYRNQFDQWPERVSQLSRVGLTADDWEFEPGKPFGHHVSKDGTEFRLWTPNIEDYLSNPNVNELSVDNRYLPTESDGSRTTDEDRIVRLRTD